MRKNKLEMWETSRWLYIKHVSKSMFMDADTSTIRLILAWASFLWGAALIFSMISAEPTFKNPYFALLAYWGSEWSWAALFIVHWAGVHWRIYDVKSRPNWAFCINTLGFVLWAVSTVSIALAVGTFTPGIMLEVTMCAASAWALYRTGLRKEGVTL